MNQDNHQVRKLARDLTKRLKQIERKVASTARANDLRHAAIDGANGPVWKDDEGNVVFQVAHDPETGVTAPEYKNGPVPAQPEAPFVDLGAELLKVQMSGLDVNGDPAPADFRRAEVHVSLEGPDFEPDHSKTFACYIEESDGSQSHRLPGGEWWVGVVWVTLSGQRSVMSDTVLADIPARVDTTDIEQNLSDATERINDALKIFGADDNVHFQESEPPAPAKGTPPDPPTVYEWTGPENNSPSVKLIDGVEVARNWMLDPRFTDVTSHWEFFVAYGDVIDGKLQVNGSRDVVDLAEAFITSISVVEGEWVAIRIEYSSDSPVDIRLYHEGYSWNNVMVTLPAAVSGNVETVSFQVPAEFTGTELNFTSMIDNTQTFRIHPFILAKSSTQQGALDQVAHYFDGDTPNVGGVPGDSGTPDEVAIWSKPSTGERFVYDHASDSWKPASDAEIFETVVIKQATILDAAIQDLTVTGTLTARVAQFLHLFVDHMDVNKLWSDEAWLTAIESSSVRLQSSLNGWQTFLSGRGMEVINPEGQPSVQLGNFEETGLTLYQHNDVEGGTEATASITDDGAISGLVISANDEFYYQGTELSELIDNDAMNQLPLGVVGDRSFDSDRGPYTIETGVGYIGQLVVPGRRYKITATGMVRDANGVGVALRLRVSHTGGEEYGWPVPSVSNTLVGRDYYLGVTSGGSRSFEFTRTWEWPNPDNTALKPTRFLLTIGPLPGTSNSAVSWLTGGQLIIEDMGLSPMTNSGWHMGGSSGGGGGTPPPPPPEPTPIKTRRVSTWTMDWWRTWWQNGNIPSSGVGTSEVVQGRTPYFTSAGTYRGMVGFPSMTSTLSGADIEKIEVRVRVTHSHSASGGRVRLGLHGNTSRPSSFTNYSNLELTNTHFGRGQEKWVTLPSSVYSGFKNGTHRGVVLYTSSTSTTYYVQARPSRFAIRVTYRK